MSAHPKKVVGGFTILEALTASALFFIAMIGASLLSLRAAQTAGDTVGQDQASKLAVQLVEQQALMGYPNLSGRLGTTLGSQQSISGKIFNYTITVTDTSGPVGGASPNLGVPSIRIDVGVSWNNSTRGSLQVQHATYVSP
jgi:Tfp pilus assembly protein PilV